MTGAVYCMVSFRKIRKKMRTKNMKFAANYTYFLYLCNYQAMNNIINKKHYGK